MNPYVALDPTVRQRASEAFAADDSGRHAGTLFDMLNVTGRRAQVIKDLVKNGDIASTLDENGKFDIPWNDRLFAGVNDDDIAKALALKSQRTRKASPLGQQAQELGVDFNTLTTDGALRRAVKKEAEYQDTSKVLKAQLAALGPEGLAASKGLGEKPSLEALTAALKVQKDKDPLSGVNQLKREEDRYDTELLRQDRSDARQDRRLSQDRALSAQTNQMNLQFQYAQLMQNDRQRSQDRQDKAMMMLVQGLGNLGSAFTI